MISGKECYLTTQTLIYFKLVHLFVLTAMSMRYSCVMVGNTV